MRAGPPDRQEPEQAGPSIPGPLEEFLRLYRAGEYWESHEVLEGPWRETRSAFYQGLILYASAWVHWKRVNAHGVDAQLRKTLERLEGYPDAYLGIDVATIRAHCREARRVVASDADWSTRIEPLVIEVATESITGDEPELPSGDSGDHSPVES